MNKLIHILALLCFGLTQDAILNVYEDNIVLSSSGECITYGVQFDAFVSYDFNITNEAPCNCNQSDVLLRCICFKMDGTCINQLFFYLGNIDSIDDVIVAGPNGVALEYSIVYHYQNGDLNSDQMLDLLDVLVGVSLIVDEIYNINADVDENGFLNVLDLVIIVNWIIERIQ